MADDDDFEFDFEGKIPQAARHTPGQGAGGGRPPHLPPGANVGQSLGNFRKNYRQTVCTYWLKGLCMKGDTCGFLHQFDQSRMPVCRTLLKTGVCKEPDCPYKHSLDEIRECNMYRLGFCVYGPQCRYKHTRLPGPVPEPETVEAAKPKEFRNINVVVNTVNKGIVQNTQSTVDRQPAPERPRVPRALPGSREPPRELADRPFHGGPPGPRPPPPPSSGADLDRAMLASVGQQNLPYGF